MSETINLNKEKIKEVLERGLRIHQEIADLREDLKTLVAETATAINVKPALLNKAVKVAFKSSLSKSREEVDSLEEILEAGGRG